MSSGSSRPKPQGSATDLVVVASDEESARLKASELYGDVWLDSKMVECAEISLQKEWVVLAAFVSGG